MAFAAVQTATLSCTCGAGTGNLIVTSQVTNQIDGKPMATIKDCMSISNITPIGMCSSLANPQVAAATAAALGVLTPQPCIPCPVGPWTPVNPQVQIASCPCLAQGATLQCAYAGTISIVNCGQTKVNV